MAGTAKPNIVGLGGEASYKLLGGYGSQGAQPEGLFNGVQANEWNSQNVMYWYGGGTYIELEIFEECNIWRSGTSSWGSHIAALGILKHNGTSYVDVTTLYPQTVTSIPHTQWEKTISKLPKGRYIFEARSGLRIDSEWYLERTNLQAFIFKGNDRLYAFENDKLTSYSDRENIQELALKHSSGEIDLSQIFTKIEYNEAPEINRLRYKPNKIKLK